MGQQQRLSWFRGCCSVQCSSCDPVCVLGCQLVQHFLRSFCIDLRLAYDVRQCDPNIPDSQALPEHALSSEWPHEEQNSDQSQAAVLCSQTILSMLCHSGDSDLHNMHSVTHPFVGYCLRIRLSNAPSPSAFGLSCLLHYIAAAGCCWPWQPLSRLCRAAAPNRLHHSLGVHALAAHICHRRVAHACGAFTMHTDT